MKKHDPQFRPMAEVDEAVERYCLIGGEFVGDLSSPVPFVMKLPAFHNQFASSRIEVGEGAKAKYIAITRAWMTRDETARVRDAGYLPGGPRIFTEVDGGLRYNTFHMPDYKGVTIDPKHVDIFRQHVARVVDGDTERELVIQWFAHIVQYPHERNRFALLMLAWAEGTGRGWLVELMKAVLGAWNVKTLQMKEFDSDFDDGFVGCLLNTVEEVHEAAANGSKYSFSESLKDRITATSMLANYKHGMKTQVRLFNNILLQSNHPDALALRDTDRRILVVRNEFTPGAGDEPYYLALYAHLKNPAFVQSIGSYLARLDLTEYRKLTRAPMTEAKGVVIDATTADVDVLVADFIEQVPTNYFLNKHVTDYVTRTTPAAELPKNLNVIIGRVLQRLAQRVPGLPKATMKHDGKAERPWVKRGKAGGAPQRERISEALDKVDAWLATVPAKGLPFTPVAAANDDDVAKLFA